MSDPSRRIRLDQFTLAERAIYDAAQIVEAIPAGHPSLTKAVTLLSDARAAVADFVDGIEPKIESTPHYTDPTVAYNTGYNDGARESRATILTDLQRFLKRLE